MPTAVPTATRTAKEKGGILDKLSWMMAHIHDNDTVMLWHSMLQGKTRAHSDECPTRSTAPALLLVQAAT
jgi:hypothetical protein